jgi:hypothetical protein
MGGLSAGLRKSFGPSPARTVTTASPPWAATLARWGRG